MNISVIIPSLNTPTLPRTLTAVLRQTRPADEIIVVGRDEAGTLAAFPQVIFIDTAVPVCAAAARNRGIAAAGGDIIALTDADCIPRPDWLAQHEQAHLAGETVVGGGVAIDQPSYWASSDNLSMFHEFVDRQQPGTRQFLPTLNISLRRALVAQVGGMDETFPGAAAEDTDWTIRLRLAGERLCFWPTAVVHHAPLRTTWPDVVRHWHNLGHNAIRVRLRYQALFNTPNAARRSLWWRLFSPIIAACVTANIYRQRRFWRYWRNLPVVYATKIIYCLGAAQAIDSGFAFDKESVVNNG